MKKTLLLAAALACSGAAQAEVWVCEQIQRATVYASFAFASNGKKPSASFAQTSSLIVDTEKGIKISDSYNGSCQVDGAIFCVNSTSTTKGDTIQTLVIYPEIKTYFLSLNIYEKESYEILGVTTEISSRMMSSAGTCTKI